MDIVNTEFTDTELDAPKPVAEVKEQAVYFRPERLAVLLNVPLSTVTSAVKRKRLRPDGYLVIGPDEFQPLFEGGTLGRIRTALNLS